MDSSHPPKPCARLHRVMKAEDVDWRSLYFLRHEWKTLIAARKRFSSDLSTSQGKQNPLSGLIFCMLLSLVLHGWISRRWEGFALLTLLIGCGAVKYSSWNEKEINAFLTPDCKWTTNPWAGLLFILQLCKPHLPFLSPGCWLCVYTNIFLMDKNNINLLHF